jgi:cytochrome b
MQKSYIWSIPTRVFHWLFVVFILLAFLTGDEDRLLNYHAVIGYGILILLIFRFFWGIFGPKYSLFKDFPIGKQKAKEFLENIFEDKQKYIGHNPLASYVMFAMLIVALLTVFTGILAFGIQEGKGILSSLNSPFFKEMELFKGIHELLSSLFIALIAAHVSGVLVDRLLHKKHETLNSIITGYKVTDDDESIKLNIYQKVFAFIMLISFVSFLVFNIYKPNNIFLTSINKPIDYQTQNEIFVNECASCHTLYPSQSFA